MDSVELQAALAAREQQGVGPPAPAWLGLPRSQYRIARQLKRALARRVLGERAQRGSSPFRYAFEPSTSGVQTSEAPLDRGSGFPLPATQSAEEVVQEALEIVAGARLVFGRRVSPERSQEWHSDPFSGYQYPRRRTVLIDLARSHKEADVVTVWEFNRFLHAPKLGQAYSLTGDTVFADAFVSELSNWADANPLGYGVNWASAMNAGLRAANWAWALLLFRQHPSWKRECEEDIRRLLALHRRFVIEHVEDWGIYSNNIFVASVASLVVVSVALLDAPDSESFISYGLSQLQRCMTEQVGSDGVHYENSVSYHLFVTEAFAYSALALQTVGRLVPADFVRDLQAMFGFLDDVTYRDGTFPLIGDSDDARFIVTESYLKRAANSASGTLALRAPVRSLSQGQLWPNDAPVNAGPKAAPQLGRADLVTPGSASADTGDHRESVAYRASGIYVLRSSRLDATVVCMPSGVHGKGGHRHNDLLSFELALDGHPAVVDPGTYCYLSDPAARMYFRCTKAHNTLAADACEQSDISPAFELLQNRAFMKVHKWSSSSLEDELDVSSLAFAPTSAGCGHRRRFALDKAQEAFIIQDDISGSGRPNLDWFFHFAPEAEVSRGAEETIVCDLPGRRLGLSFEVEGAAPLGKVQILDDWVSREFLSATRAPTLRLTIQSAPLPVRLFVRFQAM
jgi:Heparinase II/III-like protein/Heparinase II/III N-terminus